MEQNKELAEKEKNEGNEEMKKGNYADAINKYTQSISHDANEPTTYCNRALAYMKIEFLEKAIGDCTKSIEINHKYIKAYYRRGLCYGLLNKYELGIEDLLIAMTISPGDTKEILKEVIQQKDKLIASIQSNDQKQKIIQNIEDSIDLACKKKYVQKSIQEKYQKLIKLGKTTEADIQACIKNDDKAKAEKLIIEAYRTCQSFIEESKKKSDCFEKHEYYHNILTIINQLKSLKYSIELNEKFMDQKERLNKTTLLSKEQRNNATKIAEEGINFADFAKSSYGFERAFNSFKLRPEVFFEFLIFFGPTEFEKAYATTEIATPVLNGIINSFIQKTESDLYEKNHELFVNYLTSLTKTKNFTLIKNFIKKKDKEFIKRTALIISQQHKELIQVCDCLQKSY